MFHINCACLSWFMAHDCWKVSKRYHCIWIQISIPSYGSHDQSHLLQWAFFHTIQNIYLIKARILTWFHFILINTVDTALQEYIWRCSSTTHTDPTGINNITSTWRLSSELWSYGHSSCIIFHIWPFQIICITDFFFIIMLYEMKRNKTIVSPLFILLKCDFIFKM